MARNLSALILAFAVFMGALCCAAAELDPAKEAEAQKIFGSVMSPYCVARSLRDCPSSAAHELQDQIREKLAAGKTSEEILQELYVTYGQKIRATPDSSAVGVIGWAMPVAFAALGIIVLAVWLARRRDKAVSTAAAPTPHLDPAMEKRINEELSKF